MSATADPRLQRLLGGPELAAVRQRLRRRFEQVEPDVSLESVRLDKLDPDAHRALCQLSGRPSRLSRSMTLDIADLDIRLRAAGLADSLRDALERLEGPIVPHARLRREHEARWRVVADAAGPMLRAWLTSSPAAVGLLKRLSRDPERGAGLLAAADAVLARLPAAGMPRSQLAAETLGDAHALDASRPVASLVLAAWRHGEHRAGDERAGDELSAEADPAQLDESPATGQEAAAERLREVWARVGVSVSELARPALFLNLPMPVGGRYAWIAGEPDYLSLRQLLRQPPTWPVAGCRVHVCENPDIVAIAADRLGASCAPLVCTDGMPAAAQRILLDQLAAAGARLCYHGDYDWPGIGIGNFVMRTWRASPWRFGAFEYRAAVGQAPSRSRDLGTARIEALWDAELTAAMEEHGLVLAEEAVVGQLLDDLRQDAGG
ncbi:TIGR02679 family protein [Fulvimonas sp. R45]|uniref:TIGR02679 family protein n=1 Tax=Fulvimonas sp. R45 TaxID=3045937 RepID=UPI0026602A46|nr:TIGR02679 family protein [Fulvimonas sp. R45]MDO1528510.1 TIGR02679 family protein [Fulvimonas sp. R45]